MGEAFRLSVKAAKTTKPGDYCDGQGLWLVVASASARKWVFRFSFEGGIKEMGLGPVNAVSLGQARDRAQAARELVATGDNPIEARRIAKTKRGCPSFGEVASELIASKRSGWRSDIHARQWGALQDQCAPIWNKPVDAIGVIDVLVPRLVRGANELPARALRRGLGTHDRERHGKGLPAHRFVRAATRADGLMGAAL
jgi:hypothetical protein